MNGLKSSLSEVSAVLEGLAGAHNKADILICPPATILSEMAERAKGSLLQIGGQTCHAQTSGAHTGDISAEMLAEAGATYVIVGHSERRADHGETDALVAAKAEAAWRAGLTAIICVGESEAQRETLTA